MTMNADVSALIQLLQLPQPGLTTLSFCQGSRGSNVRTWAESLPVTQINRTATLLYKAIPEVASLITSFSNRLDMLEAMRPFAQQNILGLTKQFIDQPLLHTEAAMKTAIIAQAIQRRMSQGYGQVVAELLSSRPNGNFKSAEKKALGLALHRTLTGFGLQYLRSSQFYTQPPAHLWREIHSTYHIAERLGLLKANYPESLLNHRQAISLEQVYLRILMTAAARPNQLNPREIERVFELTELWCTLAGLSARPASERDIYVVDLNADHPPVYLQHEAGSRQPSADLRYLLLSGLLDAIHKQSELEEGDNKILNIPTDLPPGLLMHLQRSWSERMERSQTRNKNNAALDIVVGLTNIHLKLSGGVRFRDFVNNPGGSGLQILDEHGDVWDSAFDAEGLGRSGFEKGFNLDWEEPATHKKDAGDNTKSSDETVHRVTMLDFSSDGMRLDWRGEIPATVKAGEIIGLLESRLKPRVGLIRWVRQHRQGTQIGVQIIGYKASPAAAQLLQKVGEDRVYMHALLVSASSSGSDADQIITASYPFHVQGKVRIRDPDQNFTAILVQLNLSTSSISRFSWRKQEDASPVAKRDSPSEKKDFNDRW